MRTIVLAVFGAVLLSGGPAAAYCFNSGSVTHCMQDGRSSTYTQQGRVTQGRGFDASTSQTWSETTVEGRRGTRTYREVDGQPVPRYGYGDRDRRFDFGGAERWQFGR